MPKPSVILAVGLLLFLSACSSSGDEETSPTPPVTASPTGPLSARLPSGDALPSTCEPQAPALGATVAFVAGGLAWTMDPQGSGLACLFGVDDPGPFLWGPQGDRALLDSLAVSGLEGVPTRPAVDVDPEFASWGRPTGKSIVFVAPDGSLLKAHLERRDPTAFEDVSPFTDAHYLAVEYHPSGLAFGLVLELPGEEEAIWLSSNVGTDPRRVVFTEE